MANSNTDNANGYTSVEQILDTARRADRDHCRRESFPHWGLDCEIHGVLEGEHQEQKSSVSAKANIEQITQPVKELVCKKTDLVITQIFLDDNRGTLSE